MPRPDTFLAGVSMSPTHRCVPDLARSAIDTAVTRTYAEHGGSLTNAQLYEAVADDLGVQMELVAGASEGRSYNANARAARWSQQTLKTQGLIERVDRGRWRITAEGKNKLRRPVRGLHLVAFSTGLGVAVWGDCRDIGNCQATCRFRSFSELIRSGWSGSFVPGVVSGLRNTMSAGVQSRVGPLQRSGWRVLASA